MRFIFAFPVSVCNWTQCTRETCKDLKLMKVPMNRYRIFRIPYYIYKFTDDLSSKNTRTHKKWQIYVISIDFSHQRHMTFTHDPDNQCQIVVSFTTEVRTDMWALISNRNQSRSRRHCTTKSTLQPKRTNSGHNFHGVYGQSSRAFGSKTQRQCYISIPSTTIATSLNSSCLSFPPPPRPLPFQ